MFWSVHLFVLYARVSVQHAVTYACECQATSALQPAIVSMTAIYSCNSIMFVTGYFEEGFFFLDEDGGNASRNFTPQHDFRCNHNDIENHFKNNNQTKYQCQLKIASGHSVALQALQPLRLAAAHWGSASQTCGAHKITVVFSTMHCARAFRQRNTSCALFVLGAAWQIQSFGLQRGRAVAEKN